MKLEVADAHGKNIFKGSNVRYTGTGSAGEVLDIKIDEEGNWAKMDTTNLWYNSQFLELIDQNEYQRIKRKQKQTKDLSGKEEKVKKAVSLKKKLEDVDMSSELCDGGG